MKKLIIIIAMLIALDSFAALQYTIGHQKNHAQPWHSADIIYFDVKESGSLWASTFVSNMYDLSHEDLSSKAKMTDGNYGWIDMKTGESFSSKGISEEITFEDKHGREVSTNKYLVGNFKAGDSIGLWITNSNGVVGTSNQLVSDYNGQLQSRQTNTKDVIGNARINYGYASTGSVEFVLTGGEEYCPSGQPLPGIIPCFFVGVGIISLLKSRKK